MGKTMTMAWRNLWRNWRRTAIALVAVVLGLTLLLLFDGFIHGSDQAIFGNAVKLYGGNIQVHAPGFREKARRMPLLPLADPDAVVAAATNRPAVAVAGVGTSQLQPDVLAAARRIHTGGLVTNREGAFPVAITGVEPEIEKSLSIQAENVSAGRYLLPEDGDAVFIGQGLATVLNAGVGDRVTLLGRSTDQTMRQRSMTIVGIYDLGMREAERGAVFITLSEAQTLYNLRGQVTEVAITLANVGQEDRIIADLQKAFPGYEIDSWATLRPEITATLSSKLTYTTIFGFIIIFIASIGILNIQLMAVFERTREMGVLAALGMKGRQITNLFLLEGTLIGVIGALIGCLAGAGLVGWIGSVGLDLSFISGMGEITALMGSRLRPSIDLADTINRGLTVVVIVALASLYPAWQASRKEPAEALHHI